LLEEAGSSFEELVRMNQYLASRGLRSDYIASRDSWLKNHAPRLFRERSCASILVIQELSNENWLVEIELTALARGARDEA
jgi:enamine deaminase RidA (YjgF/YER057c/UK114 family)